MRSRWHQVARGRRLAGRLLCGWLEDCRGQDIIEYAFLAFAIGIVGIATWGTIGADILAALIGWDGNVQAIWQVQNPIFVP